MLGDTLFDTFIRAAKTGVDVMLITPGIADKKWYTRFKGVTTKTLFQPE